jgi:DNA-binding MarR family transcriptional regulator
LDNNLKKQYIQILFRFRKIGLDFPKSLDVNITEFIVMAGISNSAFCKDKSVDVLEIQKNIHVTKSAVSQNFSSLEKRGYIIRERNKTNRRRITVELTPEGKRILKEAQKQVDHMLEKTLSRFGEEKARQLVSLLNELSDISDGIENEVRLCNGQTHFEIILGGNEK